MSDKGDPKNLKLYKGGFASRFPELVVLGGIVAAFILLALDLRSGLSALLVAVLWTAGVWFNVFRRKSALIELTNEGLWVHRRFGGDVHQWSDVHDVAMSYDDQGRQQIRVHLIDGTVDIPNRLRIGRTDLPVDEVQQTIVQFRERYGPPH